MSAMQALQSVQFIRSKGKSYAVLSADEWEALIEWLETLEDLEVVRKAFADLKAAGVHPMIMGIWGSCWKG
jgi:hypothetical protein